MIFWCALLVIIWSTGFVAGKLIVGRIDPNIYLAIRFFFAALLFVAIAYFQRRPYPKLKEIPKHIVAGVFMSSLYLGLSYLAIAKGLPAGIMALIGALQPILVTLLAFVLIKEKTTLLGVIGMFVGMAGLTLVISPALEMDLSHGGLTLMTLLLGCFAVLSLSFGVTYQKMSISASDLITSMAIQNMAAFFVSLGFIFLLGEHLFVLRWESILVLLWGIFMLSGAGLFLMVWLVRKVAAAKISILLLLAPPLAAIESYFVFGEIMTSLQILGFAITIAGVYLSRVKG